MSNQIRLYVTKRKYFANLRNTTSYKPYTCALCGKGCRNKENHVDHGTGEHSFKEIVKRFERKC